MSEIKPVQKIFSQIYEKNLWGNGSGWGSLEINTRSYREFLQKFLFENSIKSVVDLGCGDWQIAKLMNWDGISYLGIDVVESVINENKKSFSNTNIEFQCLDVIQEKQLPKADLIIIKDVIQHWPNEEILKFLPKLSSYKYALITNCALGNNINGDINFGYFRPLDLCAPPFNCNCKKVFSFPNKVAQSNWEKVVYLFQSARK
jgi:SAM-dependent methyltransferase